jgi:uncharacterized membrane protein
MTVAQCAAMAPFKHHLRSTFLAGVFAAVPIVVTGVAVCYADSQTRVISKRLFGLDAPLLGIAIALAAIYLLGLAVTSIVGRWVLRAADWVLIRVPLLKPVYQAWKQVVLAPGEGIFAKVVLIRDESGQMDVLGFTSGQPTSPGGETLCVFVPAAPNPTSGRLYFVPRGRCRMLSVSPEEAFKMILSGGSYVPAGIA